MGSGGPPLVVVPGLAGSFDLLEPLISELSRDFTVFSYAYRGEGEVAFDRSYDLSVLVDDLNNFIDGLRLERPSVLGVSFGGAVAMEYAAKHPHRISSVAVQGLASRFEPGLFGQVVQRLFDRIPVPSDSPFINQFFRVLMGESWEDRSDFDLIVQRFWKTDQWTISHRMNLLNDLDLDPWLESIHTPALVLHAEHDVFVSAADALNLARLIPNGEYHLLRGAGHFGPITSPSTIRKLMRRFSREFAHAA